MNGRRKGKMGIVLSFFRLQNENHDGKDSRNPVTIVEESWDDLARGCRILQTEGRRESTAGGNEHERIETK